MLLLPGVPASRRGGALMGGMDASKPLPVFGGLGGLGGFGTDASSAMHTLGSTYLPSTQP